MSGGNFYSYFLQGLLLALWIFCHNSKVRLGSSICAKNAALLWVVSTSDPKPDLERKHKDINLRRIKCLALCILHSAPLTASQRKTYLRNVLYIACRRSFLIGCKLDQLWSPSYRWIHHPLIRMTASHTLPIPSLDQLFPYDWHLNSSPLFIIHHIKLKIFYMICPNHR